MKANSEDSDYDIVSKTALYRLRRKGGNEEIVDVNRSPFLIGKKKFFLVFLIAASFV